MKKLIQKIQLLIHEAKTGQNPRSEGTIQRMTTDLQNEFEKKKDLTMKINQIEDECIKEKIVRFFFKN